MNSVAIKRIGWAGSLAVAGAIVTLLFFCDPVREPFYPQCVLHRLTGLNCPGCGGLRAAHALLHGDIAAAWHFNAFLILSLVLLVGWGIYIAGQRLRKAPVAPIRLLWLWLYLAALVVFGIVRNLPGRWFAP